MKGMKTHLPKYNGWHNSDFSDDIIFDLLLISSTFYEQLLCRYSFAKKLQSQTTIREKLHKTLSNTTGARKMLVKLTPRAV